MAYPCPSLANQLHMHVQAFKAVASCDVLLHIHDQALKVVFEMIYSAHMAFHMHVEACKAVTTFDISNIYGHEATALLIIFSSEMSLCGLNVQVCVATSSQPICSNCVL